MARRGKAATKAIQTAKQANYAKRRETMNRDFAASQEILSKYRCSLGIALQRRRKAGTWKIRITPASLRLCVSALSSPLRSGMYYGWEPLPCKNFGKTGGRNVRKKTT